MTNLLRHPKTGVYWFRRTVPPELRPVLGKREIKRTLATKDLAMARVEASKVAVEVDRLIAAARAGGYWLTHDLDIAVMAFLAWAQDRTLNGTVYDLQSAEPGDPDEVTGLLDSYCREKLAGLTPTDLGRFRNAVIEELQPATVPAPLPRRKLRIEELRVAPTGVAKPATGLTLSGLYAAWAAETKPSLKLVAEWKTVLRRLQEHLGGDVQVRSITRDQMVGFKDSLTRMPRVISGKLKTMRVPEILEATRDQEIAPISNTSVNKALGLTAALFAWGVRNGKLDTNPAQGVKASTKKVRGRRLPYDREDIGKLFRLPVFLGDDRGPRYWLPIVGAWTGARLEELGQLKTADVRDRDGIWFLTIDPIEDEGSLKTEASRRIVPVHPVLVRLGFVDYVKTRRKAGADQLFDLDRDNRGKFTSAISKWWGREARKAVPDPRKSFHSFRHLLKDAARAAIPDEELRDRLTGHAGNETEGRQYGAGHDLEALAAAMAKIKIPGFPL
jgi:integrase